LLFPRCPLAIALCGSPGLSPDTEADLALDLVSKNSKNRQERLSEKARAKRQGTDSGGSGAVPDPVEDSSSSEGCVFLRFTLVAVSKTFFSRTF